jgi:two-component system, OmpR family, sensor histidine kinase KdpD
MGKGNPGKLRIYLGSAAGVGKTYAMLCEGHRRAERGTDVVVGFVETHGRQHTAELIEGLEVVPRAELPYRGTTFEEMDLDAVLARKPQVALIDELAHTNVPGSRNEKRWQDVEELLRAGIDVISNVNIQHLESLNDVVEKITGVPQRETVPDAVVRGAEQVELVDMTPEALRRRMAHGNIYAPDKIDAALSNYFRAGNLTALRELALLWLADKVDEGLQHYRAAHHISGTWEARERVVVALTGGPEGETLIRRAARIAARSSGGDLLAVHVTRSDALAGADPAALAVQRRLVESLGGSYHQVVGDDIPQALLTFARAENATQLVLGASRRSWLSTVLTGPGFGQRTIRGSGDIDVHIVTHAHMGRGRGLPRAGGGLTLRRQLAGYLLAAVLAPALTVVLASDRSGLNLISDVLAFLVAVIVVALVGGFVPAVLLAVVSSLLLNYYFTPPLHLWTIAEANNALALGVFVVVALLVSSVVDMAARRTRQAAQASAESAMLATTAGSVLRGQHAVEAVLDRVREAFAMDSVTLLERSDMPTGVVPPSWTVVAHSGADTVNRPDDADVDVPVGKGLRLALCGRSLTAADHRVLGAFAAYAAVALEQQRLAAAAEAARPIAEADRMRTALLTAVSHDLRTPLADAGRGPAGRPAGRFTAGAPRRPCRGSGRQARQQARRQQHPAHSDRVAPAGVPAQAPGETAEPAAAAGRGVGARLHRGGRQPAPVHDAVAPQAGARPGAAALAAHRARDGLPVPAGPGAARRGGRAPERLADHDGGDDGEQHGHADHGCRQCGDPVAWRAHGPGLSRLRAPRPIHEGAELCRAA